jgi:hypothetical protein
VVVSRGARNVADVIPAQLLLLLQGCRHLDHGRPHLNQKVGCSPKQAQSKGMSTFRRALDPVQQAGNYLRVTAELRCAASADGHFLGDRPAPCDRHLSFDVLSCL